MKFNILYEDNDLMVIDKPAGIVVLDLIDYLIEKYPKLKIAGEQPRYGIIHRLDKDTSGIILIAKNNKTLYFCQEQFKERKVIKKYLALVAGNIKSDKGKIETLIGRSPKDGKKQKVYLAQEPMAKGKREAITEYKVLTKFENFTLVEVKPKTGRKHQIRTHFAYLKHPIAGDKIYGFKNQPCPRDLDRQFLHASYLKIKMPDQKTKEFESKLPKKLEKILCQIK